MDCEYLLAADKRIDRKIKLEFDLRANKDQMTKSIWISTKYLVNIE